MRFDLLPIGGELTRQEVKVEEILLKNVGTETDKGVLIQQLLPTLLKAMLPSLEGAVDKIQETRVITGAEDFSFFEQRIPGLFMLLGISDPGVAPGAAPSNHSPYFDVNEATLMQGVRAHVAFALNYAEQTGQ